MTSARSLHLFVVCCGLVVVAAPIVARADTAAIVVAGDPGKKPTVVDAIAPWLEAKGQSVLLESLPQAEIDKLVDCFLADDPACAQPIVASSGVTRLVFAMIEVGSDEKVTVTGWLFGADGRIQARDQKECEACRVDGLTHTAQDVIATLWTGADPSHATLRVVTDPPGASVSVDGNPAGTSPVELEVTPGKHAVAVELPDHDSASTEVDATGGKLSDVSLTLQRTALVRPGKSRLPLIVIGGGAVAIITAGILFAVDEDSPPPGAMRPEHYTDTALPAALLGGVGAAAVGVGVWMMLRKPSEHPTSIVHVSSDTVVFAWEGRF